MCLAVPGRITSILEAPVPARSGRVEFGGVMKQVNLSYVPEAQVGDYVLVHVGVAISRLDEAEARRVFDYLKEVEDLSELQ